MFDYVNVSLCFLQSYNFCYSQSHLCTLITSSSRGKNIRMQPDNMNFLNVKPSLSWVDSGDTIRWTQTIPQKMLNTCRHQRQGWICKTRRLRPLEACRRSSPHPCYEWTWNSRWTWRGQSQWSGRKTEENGENMKETEMEEERHILCTSTDHVGFCVLFLSDY